MILGNLRAALFAGVLLLGACAPGLPQPDPERSEALARAASGAATTPGPETTPAIELPQRAPAGEEALEAALANPGRLAADRQTDVRRKAADVLRFFQIQPGMTVLDLFSGGGYYAEILAYLVGPQGKVVAHNNTPYIEFARAELTERFKAGRLSNVERLLAENNELYLDPGRFDAVLMIDVYHDLYYSDAANGWLPIDGPGLLAEIYKGLKPGGLLGIVDHAAPPGAPAEVGGTLHRIDPDRIKREVTAAGFVLEAESDVLRSPADDRTKSVFDPAIRGRTDQAVLRFRKPAAPGRSQP